MANPKRVAKRTDKKAKPAAKTAKTAKVKLAKKAPAKPASQKPIAKTAGKAAKAAPKTAKTKIAKPSAKAVKKAAKSATAKPVSKPSKPSKSSKPEKAAAAHKPAAVANVPAPDASAGHGVAHPTHRQHAARKPAQHAPVAGGVAARLSIASADEQTITREDGRYALPATVNIDLPKGYRPSSKEEYMNPRQLAYFRQKLKDWRDQLVEESRQTMENLREEVRDVGDDAERATRETENSLELRTRDRYRKLISKIEKALRKIEEGRYGFCEETDEEIGLERLEARPIATLSLDAQERREHLQKQMGD
jgi:RNA polymerase-binding transcription factor